MKRNSRNAGKQAQPTRRERALLAEVERLKRKARHFEKKSAALTAALAARARRQAAAVKGWERRRAREAAYSALGTFVEGQLAGDPNTWRYHKRWIKVQRPLRRMVGESAWEQIMYDIGEAYDLDDDFIIALIESPTNES